MLLVQITTVRMKANLLIYLPVTYVFGVFEACVTIKRIIGVIESPR